MCKHFIIFVYISTIGFKWNHCVIFILLLVASTNKLQKPSHNVGVSPNNSSVQASDHHHGLLTHSQAHSTSTGQGTTSLNSAAALQTTSPKAMNTMHHFTEFVKAFCDFGSEMVHLVRLTTSKTLLMLN